MKVCQLCHPNFTTRVEQGTWKLILQLYLSSCKSSLSGISNSLKFTVCVVFTDCKPASPERPHWTRVVERRREVGNDREQRLCAGRWCGAESVREASPEVDLVKWSRWWSAVEVSKIIIESSFVAFLDFFGHFSVTDRIFFNDRKKG